MVAPNPMTADDLKVRTKGFGRSLEITFGDDLPGNKHLGKFYLPFLFRKLGRVLLSRWCFQRFFIFTPIWGNDPI